MHVNFTAETLTTGIAGIIEKKFHQFMVVLKKIRKKYSMKVLTIIGARPQFIKAAELRESLHARGHREILVHTGQHYDYSLSKVFFEELSISEPEYHLEVGSALPSQQIGTILMKLEGILSEEKPDVVLVYGDTNSTLAAALAAVKANFPLVHVESGERNFWPDMTIVHPSTIPEETNRVITDHLSQVNFCASERAVENLKNEGVVRNVIWSGDIMLDSFNKSSGIAQRKSRILEKLGLKQKEYILATVHRAVNTDNPDRLKGIVTALLNLGERVIFPVHPRTRNMIEAFNIADSITQSQALEMIEPVGYFDMLLLEMSSRLIITDSGGVTREAFFAGVPAVIVDDTTAWIDLVLAGWSSLAGAETERILSAVRTHKPPTKKEPLLGNGNTSMTIVTELETIFGV